MGTSQKRWTESQVECRARKGKQNTTVLKYSGAVLYVGQHTDKLIKTFKKLDVKVGIGNNAAMMKKIGND